MNDDDRELYLDLDTEDVLSMLRPIVREMFEDFDELTEENREHGIMIWFEVEGEKVAIRTGTYSGTRGTTTAIVELLQSYPQN